MNIETILVTEPQGVENLYPFSVLHCGWEIRCGAYKLYEKLEKLFPEKRIVYVGREYHLASFLARNGIQNQTIEKHNTLMLFSCVLPSAELISSMQKAYEKHSSSNAESMSVIFTNNRVPVAAYFPKEELINPSAEDIYFLQKMTRDFYAALPKLELSNIDFINHLWDAIRLNAKALRQDFELFEAAPPNTADYAAVHILEPENVKIGKDTKIMPGVVIDAEEGPVIIGNNVKIMPQATIIGPCYIGDNSIIKIGAKIYEDSSIGEFCKVGGEVEASIIHAYSNKQHDGFLGHSYISEWVNLGADTNTSDLKNTYGQISVMLEDNEIDTGTMFLGLLCGDHTKSAINTSFTTGSVAGVCGILVHDGVLPKSIPSYAWTGRKNCPVYKLSKALEVAETVMKRRGKELLPEEITLLKAEYEKITAK